jgi:predicted nucleic acid-binding Zn ribbon protein
MKSSRRFKTQALEHRPLKGVGEDPEWVPGEVVTVSQSMTKLLSRLHLEERLQQDKIRKIWPRIVGEFNSQNSFPESLKKKVLTVRVSNSPYLHQLTMIKAELLKKIQKECGPETIKEIRLSV